MNISTIHGRGYLTGPTGPFYTPTYGGLLLPAGLAFVSMVIAFSRIQRVRRP